MAEIEEFIQEEMEKFTKGFSYVPRLKCPYCKIFCRCISNPESVIHICNICCKRYREDVDGLTEIDWV